VIGAGVFAQPALLAAYAGAWSPWIVAAIGVASLLIALSFAEVGSRFDGTGGPYLYTRAAFGRFAAFEVGWMLWFTRAASWAAVINILATSLSYYGPALASGRSRAWPSSLRLRSRRAPRRSSCGPERWHSPPAPSFT
jgi:amino acid transporter